MKRVAKHKHSAGLGRRTQGSGPQQRVRSTEDEDSPKGYRSPKPATLRGAGRKALFAGNSGQLGIFRQTDCSPLRESSFYVAVFADDRQYFPFLIRCLTRNALMEGFT